MRRIYSRIGLAVFFAIALGMTGAPTRNYSPLDKAFYERDALIAFIRPGLTIKINSAQIGADGTISTIYSVTEPKGLPLDNTGLTTPGTVSLSHVAAVLPKDQTTYTSYTTRQAIGTVSGTVTQAAADTGGGLTPLGNGVYQYIFGTKAPTGFDKDATHTIGIYASRNLTEFDLGTNYASATFDFVPNGAAVVRVHDEVKTEGCNSCHDQLSAHGGSRRGVQMCVLCHTPQTVDPDTGNTVDFKVMVHKIHMGSSLPSVQAGKPYQIIGNANSLHDWSTVVYPADVRRCETCHSQAAKPAQANVHLTRPSIAACGACHDNVNFATGEKHAGGPQFNDNQCSTCHTPQGELDFDASIKGAHVVPTESRMLSGLAVEIVKVTNGTAGNQPIVSFKVKDNAGGALPLSSLASLSFVMAGPASDYGYTSFGSDVTTPGYVSESALAAPCGGDGTCNFTFNHPIPANATGTFTVGVEARRTEVLLPGTTKEQTVTSAAANKVMSFSVDSSPVAPRREVVATSNCIQCHVALSLHGGQRNQTEYCVLCHNPSNTDVARRPGALVAADRALPPQGINFNLLVHRIHSGEKLLEADRPYVVVGFGGTHNDFSEVRYPAMSPSGATGDLRNCSKCHVGGSELNLPVGKNAVTDPQGPINPVLPVASACTGCHVQVSTGSHALANSTSLGESCAVCHGANGAFSVGKSHAAY